MLISRLPTHSFVSKVHPTYPSHILTRSIFYVMLIPQQHTPGAFPYLSGSACFVHYRSCHCYLDMAPQEHNSRRKIVYVCRLQNSEFFWFSDMNVGRSEVAFWWELYDDILSATSFLFLLRCYLLRGKMILCIIWESIWGEWQVRSVIFCAGRFGGEISSIG